MSTYLFHSRRSQRFTAFRAATLLALLAVVLLVAPVQAASSLTFSWTGNTESSLTGYRLYYGAESRFKNDGQEKTNFTYARYLDLASWTRCNGTNDSCEPITNGVSCSNLKGTHPTCTVDGMAGTLYFSLTAYNGSAESNFAREIEVVLNKADTSRIRSVTSLVSALLLDE